MCTQRDNNKEGWSPSLSNLHKYVQLPKVVNTGLGYSVHYLHNIVQNVFCTSVRDFWVTQTWQFQIYSCWRDNKTKGGAPSWSNLRQSVQIPKHMNITPGWHNYRMCSAHNRRNQKRGCTKFINVAQTCARNAWFTLYKIAQSRTKWYFVRT